ncbi:MAG: ABC transporter permease subunit, partial [Parvibaculaceae bacterium]|nr:ABC transporter permease subunit [Parvibaculaceae bacterium]
MFDNVATNLRQQNIASGLSFLGEEAGFGISQTLIAYSEQSSYGRALWVGLLNTLLCAAVGIFFASLLGFSIGIARLSSNWLVAKLAAAYVDLLRNVPLLLQIFFWYFAVLRSLPGPDDSYAIGGSFFLNNRGIFLPAFLMDGYAGAVIAALVIGAVLGW